ncbi:ferredoxin--NADP reductase [Paenibacillus xylaniclasticus]|uniref:ferredoxin--NADP reductase n=1 Tax=Paenibacillus xylaniclasticus TaxID=588083 RepID=UPI000FDAB172|nr:MULTISPECIES: dihydropteridine reductase [Paenibacillus]GFN33168.1 ferredoxin--NADP(+) reductase [Paenibacillus curdlanolyticus]
MQIYWLKIKKIVEETPEIKTFLLERPEDFTWDEGAHTHFAMKGFNAGNQPNRSLVRHMSISTVPSEDAIGITTRIKEQCSEFKSILKQLQIGDEVALFKTHTNLPLKRNGKNVYLLSSGVGIATFRSIVLDYFNRPDNIKHMHSLNIESSKQFLFTDLFKSAPDRSFTAQFVDNRQEYYAEVQKLAADKDGLFYIVGSDQFLADNIAILRENGIPVEQIMLDKRQEQKEQLLA